MVPRTRLLIGCGAVALAWMFGYGMGGGFSVAHHSDSDSTVNDEPATGRGGHKDGDGAAVRSAESLFGDSDTDNPFPWTRERLLVAGRGILRQPDAIQMLKAATTLSGHLGPKAFPAALETANELEEKLDEERAMFSVFWDEEKTEGIYSGMMLMRWVELDPAAAAVYVQTHGDLYDGNSQSAKIIAATWGASDPVAAITWAKTVQDPQHRKRIIKAIIVAAARRDLANATRVAEKEVPESMTDGSFGEAIGKAKKKDDPEQAARAIEALNDTQNIARAAMDWASKDPEAALKWAEGISDEEMRKNALGGMGFIYAQARPEEVALQIDALKESTVWSRATARCAAIGLGRKDLKAASAWAASIKLKQEREEAISGLMSLYAQTNAHGAREWIGSLPIGRDRDLAVIGYLVERDDGDAKELSDLAASIASPKSREQCVRDTLTHWFTDDPGGALEWLNNTPLLSEEEKREILKKRR